MGVLDSLIVTACVGLSGQAKEACVKGLQAASQQSGVQQQVSTYESHQTKKLQENVTEVIGTENTEIIAGTAWLTNSAINKKAYVDLPNLGVCSKISAEIDKNSARLLFKWNF